MQYFLLYPPPGSLGEVAHTHLDGGAHATHGAPMASNTKNSSNSPNNNNTNNNNAPNNANNAPPSPRPDRGLFLNLTGALFGEGKLQQVISENICVSLFVDILIGFDKDTLSRCYLQLELGRRFLGKAGRRHERHRRQEVPRYHLFPHSPVESISDLPESVQELFP